MTSKIYTKKMHIWLTQDQFDKLDTDAKNLKVKKVDIVRRNISKEYPYINLISSLLMDFKKQGNLLNQVARHCNETHQAGEEILPTLREIAHTYRVILDEIKAK